MDLLEQMLSGRFSLVAVVNDGQVALSPRMFNVSPAIRARAIVEAQREQSKFTNRLTINIPGTVQDLRTLEWYLLYANQNVCAQPGEKDLPTLITVAELAMHLEIPGVADLVTSDISQVLVLRADDGEDVKDYPWLNLCYLANETGHKKLFDSVAWCFLNAARATRSMKDALWAFRIGQVVHQETGYQGLWTYGMYLCVVWGAFRLPEAPRLIATLAAGVHSRQMTMVTLMEGLVTPQLCEVHNSWECVSGDVRQRCVDHWRAVWQQAHQIASKRIYDEYRGTSFSGAERDVLRMLYLISDALQEVTQTEPGNLVSPACDLKRLHESNGWVLEQQGTIRSIINQLA